MGRFVKPQTVRLPLSDGDYIDVKRRLTTGEQHDVFAIMAPTMTVGEKVLADSRHVQTARVLAYLLTWSLTDDGQPVPMNPMMSEADRLSTIRSLDPDTFREIRQAVDAHEATVDKEIAALKNGRGGESVSSVTLPSPSVVTGDIATS